MTANPLRVIRYDDLLVSVHQTGELLGEAAAREAAGVIQAAIHERGGSNLILATGNSQRAFLEVLRQLPGIDWSKVRVFHMDEYLGIDPRHPASFPGFLRRHLLDHVDPAAFYPLSGRPEDVAAECQAYAELLRRYPADLCVLGIGENGHLAFNDPPFADFDDPAWVKVVRLAEASRRQQVGEGHFGSIDEVPTHAITLTIPALLAAKRVLVLAPEARKAGVVARALTGPIAEDCPASILRKAPHAHLLLDVESAGRIL